MKRTLFSVLFAIVASIVLSSPETKAEPCDFRIVKTMHHIQSASNEICLADYFTARNMGSYSQVRDPLHEGRIVRDLRSIHFNDMMLFDVNANPLGENVRIQLVKNIYAEFLASLRNEFGACDLTLQGNGKTLSIDDFSFFRREAEGQPGSRLMLKSEGINAPQWSLVCPDATRKNQIEKSGDYFFIFIDVYENIGTLNIKHHLSHFLFSLN